jgi:hypothetical protein
MSTKDSVETGPDQMLAQSQRPGNRPAVAHSQPRQAQSSGRKPTRQTLPSAAVSCAETTDQHAAANARAAASTCGPASSSWPSRSRRAGGTSSSCGFMPWNQACTTARESRSASRAAAW